MNAETTTTGTVEDVAAFFRVSVRTVQNWIASSKPRLTFWREGRNLCFGEESVVELRVKFLIAARAHVAGEAEEIARREWRNLLALRAQVEDGRWKMEDGQNHEAPSSTLEAA